MQIREALHEFHDALIADRMKPKTAEWYMWMLLKNANSPILWLESQQLDQLESVNVKALRRYLVMYTSATTRRGTTVSDATINAMIRALHKFFRWCAGEYNIHNAMQGIAYPKRKKPSKRIDLQHLIQSLQKMIAAVDGDNALDVRDRALLYLLIDSGVRAGGLVGLQMSDLYLEESSAIVFEKGDKWRWVVFASETGAALRAWSALRDKNVSAVFYNLRTRQPLTVAGLRSIVRSIARRAGVEERIYTHLMRKSFVSLYTFAGGDVLTASLLAGHADVKTTIDHYVIYNSRELAQKHAQYSPLRFLLK